MYSGTSVIRTSINRLLVLSGLEGRILLLTPSVHSEMMASLSGSARKRKRLVLPLESKIAILERLKAGATQAQLAEENGIGSLTVGDIKRNEAKVRFTYPAISLIRP